MALNAVRHTRCGSGFLTVACVTLVLSTTGHAHLTVEGVGDVANGALHPVMTPVHVMVFLGLGLLLGQQVPFRLKTPMRVFMPALAAALLVTLTGRVSGIHQLVLIILALLVATLVALQTKVPGWILAVLCGAVACAIGMDSGLDTGSSLVRIKTLAGTWLSLNAAVFYIAACASHGADGKWASAGIRILGSWIIAISLMMLAFSLRK